MSAEGDSGHGNLRLFAGTGVAMGNAPDEIKAAANFVTDTNNNDGVAKAIQKLVY